MSAFGLPPSPPPGADVPYVWPLNDEELKMQPYLCFSLFQIFATCSKRFGVIKTLSRFNYEQRWTTSADTQSLPTVHYPKWIQSLMNLASRIIHGSVFASPSSELETIYILRQQNIWDLSPPPLVDTLDWRYIFFWAILNADIIYGRSLIMIRGRRSRSDDDGHR